MLSVDAKAMQALKNYSWPGNIRELQNTIEQLRILVEGNEIRLEDLPFNIRMAPAITAQSSALSGGAGSSSHTIAMSLEDLEKNHILQMLAFQHGNKTKTAKVLGITIKTLYNKLHRYGMLDGNKSGAPEASPEQQH